jgi:hypothetical protein
LVPSSVGLKSKFYYLINNKHFLYPHDALLIDVFTANNVNARASSNVVILPSSSRIPNQ